jgi:phosphoglycerate dehydrogenase-like enzyme
MPVALIVPETMRPENTPYATMLRAAGFEVKYPREAQLARGWSGAGRLIEELAGVQAVIAGGGEAYTPEVLDALPELRVIARAGVGYDRVHVPAASERRIAVTITPTANHEGVAEHTLALIFAAAKFVVEGDKQLRAGVWSRVLTEPIRGKTLGVVGMGRIGRSLVVRAKALGMQVIVCEKFPLASFVREQQVELVELDELLQRSDYVSLHCPHCEETTGLINRQTLARMKQGSTLINTARGKLVVEADLIDALKSGHLRAAGLDVFEQEPPATDNPLFQMPNVVATPHLAGGDYLSLENMGIECAQNIIALSQNRWPEGAVVNDSLRDGWKW